MLQINLTVLATAHAVSESIVRGVNAEMQRRSMPNTYTAAGQARRPRPAPHHAAVGQPLALARADFLSDGERMRFRENRFTLFRDHARKIFIKIAR